MGPGNPQLSLRIVVTLLVSLSGLRAQESPNAVARAAVEAISFRIVDEARKPLANAQVVISVSNHYRLFLPEAQLHELDQATRLEKRSDVEGMVTFEALPPGRIEALIGCEGFAVESWLERYWAPRMSRGLVEVRLRKGTVREGRLTDHKGKAVPGAILKQRHLQTLRPDLNLTRELDEDGAFQYSAEAGFVGTTWLSISVGSNIEVQAMMLGPIKGALLFELPRCFPYSGQVLAHESGLPVAGAKLQFRADDPDTSDKYFGVKKGLVIRSQTDAMGNFRVDLPRDLDLRVKISHPDFLVWSGGEAETLRLDNKSKKKLPTWQMSPPLIQRGRVTLTDEATPVAGARVVAADYVPLEGFLGFHAVTTDEKGDFELRLTESFSQEFAVWHPRWLDVTGVSGGTGIPRGWPKTGIDSIEARMVAPIRVRGLVLDNKRNPVAGAAVFLSTEKNRGFVFNHFELFAGHCGVSAADGSFELSCPADLSTALIYAMHPDFVGRGRTFFRVNQLSKKPLPVVMNSGVRISGRICDEAGLGLEGQCVYLKTEKDPLARGLRQLNWQYVKSDAEGKFSFPELLAGKIEVTISPKIDVLKVLAQPKSKFETVGEPKLEFLLSPGETRELELKVRPVEAK